MRQAMALAAGVRRSVSPRPWVGAVVVPEGDEGGGGFTGATQGRGGPHAEVVALERAGGTARGSTLYCTLEPCAHHGSTAPCTEAVIDAGVARVVVGLEDPDVRVAGKGLAALRAAGIDVVEGLCRAEVAEQLQPYVVHRRTGRPQVVLKLAATLDGKVAAPDGSSRWITGPEARRDAHRLRADSDAVMVGAGTVREDDPALTVRLPDGEAEGVEPLRVVLGTAPEGAKVQPALELEGDLGEVLDELGRRGILQLLVEGGPKVAHGLHGAGLVDRYVVYLAPALMGGDDGRSLFTGPGAGSIDDVWRGRIAAVSRLGEDLRIDLVPGVGH